MEVADCITIVIVFFLMGLLYVGMVRAYEGSVRKFLREEPIGMIGTSMTFVVGAVTICAMVFNSPWYQMNFGG